MVGVNHHRRAARLRAECARDEARLVGRAVGVGGAAGEPGGRQVHLDRQVFHAEVYHRDAVSVEGVGLDDVRARFQIRPVNVLNHIGPDQHQGLVVVLEVNGMVLEALRPVVLLLELVALDHRPHRPVEDQDALTE